LLRENQRESGNNPLPIGQAHTERARRENLSAYFEYSVVEIQSRYSCTPSGCVSVLSVTGGGALLTPGYRLQTLQVWWVSGRQVALDDPCYPSNPRSIPLPSFLCAAMPVPSRARLAQVINGKIGAHERRATDYPRVVRTRVGVVDGRVYLFHLRLPARRPQGAE